jgi:Putative Flp pilus-assembly TadE/G-like
MRMRRVRLFNDERGATAIIVVLSLVALIGMVALTADAGSLVVQRRRLVKIADAAALAAALSYGTGEAVCGTSDDIADAQANTVALRNAEPYAAAPTLTIVRDCGLQMVKVTATAPSNLSFAPALGFASTRDVHAVGRARWGGAAAFFGSSLMLRADTLQACGLIPIPPDTDPPPDITCGIWINNGNPQDLGNAQWAMLNLFTQSAASQFGTQWGWDVSLDYNCPQGVDVGRRAKWLTTGVNWSLPFDKNPMAGDGLTYVCPGSGSGQSVMQALRTQQYQVKQWPINCAWQGQPAPAPNNPSPECDAPHGQLAKNGTSWVLCPPDTCSNPDKYDIIGFIPLQIWDFPRGDTQAAIGTPGQTGNCKKNSQTFDQLLGPTTFNLDTISGNGCPAGLHFDTIAPYNPSGTPDPYAPYVYKKTGTTTTVYTPCNDSTGTAPSGCNYYYDPVTHVITWLLWPVGTTSVSPSIEFNWTKNATPGACGSRPSDPNATCLILKWVGPQQGGEDVGGGGGYNFGTNGVSLCTINDSDCNNL